MRVFTKEASWRNVGILWIVGIAGALLAYNFGHSKGEPLYALGILVIPAAATIVGAIPLRIDGRPSRTSAEGINNCDLFR